VCIMTPSVQEKLIFKKRIVLVIFADVNLSFTSYMLNSMSNKTNNWDSKILD